MIHSVISPRAALACVVLVVAFVGCGTPRVAQPEPPPPRPERYQASSAPVRTPTDEAAAEQFLDAEIARRSAQPGRSTVEQYQQQRDAMNQRPPTDEDATNIFLDHEIERRRYVEPAAPPQRIVVREYENVPPELRDSYRHGYDSYRSRFPWSTAAGAGIGAIIGHQSGHRDRGAAIGAGVGLLFDLTRWH